MLNWNPLDDTQNFKSSHTITTNQFIRSNDNDVFHYDPILNEWVKQFKSVKTSQDTACDSRVATEESVNHPPHYNKHPSGIECIQITRHMNFNLGNAVKYIWRADLKNDAIEDLKKAVWYIQDEIQRREKK